MKVQKEYRNMLENLGAEFEILREVPIEDIQKAAGTRIAEGIRRLRNGEVERHPGLTENTAQSACFGSRSWK